MYICSLLDSQWKNYVWSGYKGHLRYIGHKLFVIDGSDSESAITAFLSELAKFVASEFDAVESIPKERLFQELIPKFDLFQLLTEIRYSDDKSVRKLFHNLSLSEKKLDNVLKVTVSAFLDCTSHLKTLVSQGELSTSELKRTLESYSQSDPLYHIVEAFTATSRLTSNMPKHSMAALKSFQSECLPFSKVKEVYVQELFFTLSNKVKRTTFLHTEALSSPNAQDRDHFYLGMFRSYDNLARSATLKAYVSSNIVNLETMEEQCDEHLIRELNKIKDFLVGDIIGSPRLSKSDYADFSIWFDNLRSFKNAFETTKLAQHAATIQREVLKKFRSTMYNIVAKASGEKDNNLLVQHLFSLKSISVNIAVMKDDVDKIIDDCLTTIKDEDNGPQRIINIGILLNASADPMALMIVADHKAFEGSQLYLFNTKVARFTIENVLDQRAGITGTNLGRDIIKEQFNLFDTEYQAVVSLGLLKVNSSYFLFLYLLLLFVWDITIVDLIFFQIHDLHNIE